MVANFTVTCAQCEESQTFSSSSDAEAKAAASDAGWARFGTGASADPDEVRSQCRRCTGETIDTRAKRFTRPLIEEAGVHEVWDASTQPGSMGCLMIWTEPETTKITFDVLRTDSKIRETSDRDSLRRTGAASLLLILPGTKSSPNSSLDEPPRAFAIFLSLATAGCLLRVRSYR